VAKDHFTFCFISDAAGIEQRDRIGLDRIMWECDYPHSDSSWPLSPEALRKQLDNVSNAEINQMTHLNAMRVFRYDPFARRPRESCTVGALRSRATKDQSV
jgi:hypothetical protein